MDPIQSWHDLLQPDRELTPAFCQAFAASMRAKKLTFGDRVHCPFLRPFFLTEGDEQRIRTAAETIAAAGERIAQAAMESSELFDALGITDAEADLIRLEPGYHTASTASPSCCPTAFISPSTTPNLPRVPATPSFSASCSTPSR
jgi:hypothetical protein